jgi:hypothetical protein
MSIYSEELSLNSKKTYMSALKKLNNKVEPTDLKFLKNTDVILGKINEIDNPNSRRGAFISVVTALKDKPKFKKEYELYHTGMMCINKVLNTESYKSEKTKEKHSNVDFNDLKQTQECLYSVVIEIGKKKKITDDQYKRLHDLAIVSLYMLIPPRRVLDYSCMIVGVPTDDKEFNYYNDGKFYFNNYKTKGTYDQQAVDVPRDLQDILKVWLKFKRGEDNHLLTKNSQQTAYNNTAYTAKDLSRYVKIAFANPNMGISLLRGKYLTNKFGDVTHQLKDDITAMGTSLTVATGTYIE